MMFKLPPLPYYFDALEPFFDKETMKIHYTKHHQTYINNINNILKNIPQLINLSVEELIQKLELVPVEHKTAIRNNAGGHANHSFFWNGLKKETFLDGTLKIAIQMNFGDIDNFKTNFEKIALACFGSGWVWLVKKDNKLFILSTANQDNPLMGNQGVPILGLDLWEHAYYLKYQNRRSDYIKAFWHVVNWDEAAVRFNKS
ncbi:Fe-Mn family superoxide dismutase [Candidatus Palibaumannia cicadellinicola]|uniref:Superoxide dismutase n=1 Tax=Candidatus Palibaumannia cicadellinicola TaxID=186490 RepID=A0A0K2BLW0_9GAMM|nr:Fe-Mn family superoxide dismutase [Candidatus Baumannia cicadellinicola]AKZ66018.1 Manganese superoxide dismutase [Candidatus Baumannia cicadellinicola]